VVNLAPHVPEEAIQPLSLEPVTQEGDGLSKISLNTRLKPYRFILVHQVDQNKPVGL